MTWIMMYQILTEALLARVEAKKSVIVELYCDENMDDMYILQVYACIVMCVRICNVHAHLHGDDLGLLGLRVVHHIHAR